MTESENMIRLRRDWDHCHRCPLGDRAKSWVLWETVPERQGFADVLFVGEGPGAAEDILGRPFVGPSGKYLRRAVQEASPDGLVVGYTNLVACRPQSPSGLENRAPLPEEILACTPRFKGVIEALGPSVIVCLGRVPENYVETEQYDPFDGSLVYIPHPASILRKGGLESPEHLGYVAVIKDVFRTARGETL